MLSHVRRERFLVITLLALENKRSGAAEVAGIASTRLAKFGSLGGVNFQILQGVGVLSFY